MNSDYPPWWEDMPTFTPDDWREEDMGRGMTRPYKLLASGQRFYPEWTSPDGVDYMEWTTY